MNRKTFIGLCCTFTIPLLFAGCGKWSTSLDLSGRIACKSLQSILVIDNDKAHVVNVIDFGQLPDVFVWVPVWSPDGTRIAFASNHDEIGNTEIYSMDADGQNILRLTHNPGDDTDPAWSPDGSQIVFSSIRNGVDTSDIYVMNADGSNLVKLTDHPADDRSPAWSPDGNLIAFASTRDGNGDIYTMRTDGTYLMNLTHHPGVDDHPAWSPDGRHIAFDSLRADSEVGPGIYIMHQNGSDQRKLVQTSLSGIGLITASNPEWSPDGRLIAFTGEEYKSPHWIIDVHVVNINGKNLVRLPDKPGCISPSWIK